jgi:ureidoglycolate dehydrogenase (NAD+)
MSQSNVKVIAWEPLQEFAKEVLVKVGMPPDDAATEAEVIVWANRRGVDSHGVQLLPWYIEAVDIGHMKVKPDIKIVKETPVALSIEADHAFGAVVTTFAMKKAMAKAKEIGIGWAFIRRTNHQGCMGYYPLMAAQNDMAGITWVCGNTSMPPFGSKFPGLANNPIAISVPSKRHRPLVLDMATSIIAGAKLMVFKDKGLPIPEGWALDEDGNPTTDPWKARLLLPIGGPKGSGLSLMLECLGSLIVDFPKVEPVVTGKQPPFGMGTMVGNPDRIRQHIQNSVVVAIDIGTFTELAKYKEHIDNMIDGIKSLPKAEGFDEIFVPGEPEWRTWDERTRNGIPLPEKTADNLSKLGERLGVKLPLT